VCKTLIVLLLGLAAGPLAAPAAGQAAIAAAEIDDSRLPPSERLTLRPLPGLEALATKVARVLTLRTGMLVDVGDAPPADILEAVPMGHIALAREGDQVRLVLGAALGRSFEASVQADGAGESDVRSVALAVETLRDRAIEARSRLAPAMADGEPPLPSAETPQPSAAESSITSGGLPDAIDSDARLSPRPLTDRRLRPVQPLFYLRAYSGASPASTGPRVGVGAGGGLCVIGHCLLLTVEYPMPFGMGEGGEDIRYRYTTFTSGFYTRPLTWGRFTPGASVGFLTRLGHFERDMGISGAGGLETDLGVRTTLEAGYELMTAVDALAEVGLDYALDRWRLGHGSAVAYRGERLTPWLQAGVRVRAY
jgi:hypothetical protein